MTQKTITSLRMTEIYLSVFPFLLDWSNSGGKTALHIAAQAGHDAFISLVCELGADIDLTDLQGNTPLHYASAWGHLNSIRVLIERGCEVGTQNHEGYTAGDFSYSLTTHGVIQSIAREVMEGKRNNPPHLRRWGQGNGRGRMRSGSMNTIHLQYQPNHYLRQPMIPPRSDQVNLVKLLHPLNHLYHIYHIHKAALVLKKLPLHPCHLNLLNL